jgi:tRNA pseudouridine38-40 synthase
LRTIKVTLAYDGTEFAGWQRQANERTVQAVVEDALAPIEKGAVTVIGAGRTDAGVHAAGQVATFQLTNSIACDALQRALNATLPGDVRVVGIDEAPPDFNARFDARRKTYHYWISNGAAVPPPLRRYAWHIPQPIDIEAAASAAACLTGEHDFAAFQATGSDVQTTIRTIFVSRLEAIDASLWSPVPQGLRLIRYEVTGTGFLRHMVRNIAGTLADVGRGRMAPEDMRAILRSRDRARAAATAPPHGLTLWSVEYPPPLAR